MDFSILSAVLTTGITGAAFGGFGGLIVGINLRPRRGRH